MQIKNSSLKYVYFLFLITQSLVFHLKWGVSSMSDSMSSRFQMMRNHHTITLSKLASVQFSLHWDMVEWLCAKSSCVQWKKERSAMRRRSIQIGTRSSLTKTDCEPVFMTLPLYNKEGLWSTLHNIIPSSLIRILQSTPDDTWKGSPLCLCRCFAP